MNDSDPMIGKVIDERFKIVSICGSGASSKIYRAQHLLLDKEIAIKLFNRTASQNEKSYQRFLNEASALSKLDHPNIIRFLGFGETTDKRPFISTEYIVGCTLQELVSKHAGGLSSAQALPILIQICKGIEYIHSKGIVHRDIKPSNVMVCQESGGTDIVKLIDFGLLKQAETSEQHLTQTGEILGTADYMSPEQCRDGRHADAKSDIYALGCMMYFAVTGISPMRGDSELATMQNHLNKKIKSVKGAHAVPRQLEKMIVACTNRDPSLRPNISIVLAALETMKPGKERSRFADKIAITCTVGVILLLCLMLSPKLITSSKRRTANPIRVNKVPKFSNTESADNWLSKRVNDSIYSAYEVSELFIDSQKMHFQNSVPQPRYERLSILRQIKTRLLSGAGKIKSNRSSRLQSLYASGRCAAISAELDEFDKCLSNIKSLNPNLDDENFDYHSFLISCSELAKKSGKLRIATNALASAIEHAKAKNDPNQLCAALVHNQELAIQVASKDSARITANSLLSTMKSLSKYELHPENMLGLHQMARSIAPQILAKFAAERISLDDKVLIDYLKESTESTNEELTRNLAIALRLNLSRLYELSGNKKLALKTLLTIQPSVLNQKFLISSNDDALTKASLRFYLYQIAEIDKTGGLLSALLDRIKSISQKTYSHILIENLLNNDSTSPEFLSKIYQRTNQLIDHPDKLEEKDLLTVFLGLGRHFLRLEKYQDALDNFRKAHAIASDERSKLKSLIGAAIASEELNQLENSVDYLNQADSKISALTQAGQRDTLSQEIFDSEYLKGKALFAQGKKIEAINVHRKLFTRYQQQSISGIDDFDQLGLTLAKELDRTERHEQASEVLRLTYEAYSIFRFTEPPIIRRVIEKWEEQLIRCNSHNQEFEIIKSAKGKCDFWQVQ